MDSNEDNKLERTGYRPGQDRLLYVVIVIFIAILSLGSLSVAVWLSVTENVEIALAFIGIGTGCIGSLTAFFTQNIGK